MNEREVLDELSGTDDPVTWAMEFAKFVSYKGELMSGEDVVNWFDEAMTTAKAFQWREDSRETLATQEMLGHVIAAAGGTVEVSKEQLTRGHSKGAEIVIDDDIKKEVFVFRLEQKDVQ